MHDLEENKIKVASLREDNYYFLLRFWWWKCVWQTFL